MRRYDNKTLSYPDILQAAVHFYSKMLARGWNREDVFLIFIVRRSIPVNLFTETSTSTSASIREQLAQAGFSIAILGLNAKLPLHPLWQWMRPTLQNWATQMQSVCKLDSEQDFLVCTMTAAEITSFNQRAQKFAEEFVMLFPELQR